MKIGVMSDSHGRLDYVDLAMEYLEDVDLIIHAGDHYRDAKYIEQNYNIKVIAVSGNCDPRGIDERLECIGGKTIFVTHGHAYSVKMDPSRIFYAAKEREAHIAIFGHTHESFYAEEDGVIIINPGSVGSPRGYSERSFCIIDIEDGNIDVEFISF